MGSGRIDPSRTPALGWRGPTLASRGELDWLVEVYALDEIVRAHEDMEHDRVAAKQVVLTRGQV